MVDIIIELIVEFVVQVLLDVILEFAGDFLGRLASTRVGALVTRLAVTVALGVSAGWLWGAHVVDPGRLATPHSVWVGIGLAVVSLLTAIIARRDPDWDDRFAGWPAVLRVPVSRLAMFAVLNVAFVLGVEAGFS